MHRAVITLTLVGLAACLGPKFVPVDGQKHSLNHALRDGESVKGYGIYDDRGKPAPSKFGFNLLNAANDIILHVDWRTTREVLVLNDKKHNLGWNSEIRKTGGVQALFKKNEIFVVEVVQHSNKYEIKLNGKPVKDFPRGAVRNDRSKITDLHITKIQSYNGASLGKWQLLEIPRRYNSPVGQVLGGIAQKHHITLQRDLQVGDEIHANGFYGVKGKRLRIALGGDKEANGSYNFKLNIAIRTDILNTNKKVYINYRQDGKWNSPQMFANTFPFKEGHGFRLTIRLEQTAFKILIDGKALDKTLPYTANKYKLSDIEVIELTTEVGDSHKWLSVSSNNPKLSLTC